MSDREEYLYAWVTDVPEPRILTIKENNAFMPLVYNDFAQALRAGRELSLQPERRHKDEPIKFARYRQDQIISKYASTTSTSEGQLLNQLRLADQRIEELTKELAAVKAAVRGGPK